MMFLLMPSSIGILSLDCCDSGAHERCRANIASSRRDERGVVHYGMLDCCLLSLKGKKSGPYIITQVCKLLLCHGTLRWIT
jgi:hypothetical protein